MKLKITGVALGLCLTMVMAAGHAANQPEPWLDLRGQAVTGHQVTNKRLGGLYKMTFTVAKEVPGEGTTWAFVCRKLANGQVPDHVSFYFHGDNRSGWVQKNPRELIGNAKKIRRDTCWVIAYRPYSRGNQTWRTRDEMRYHLAMVDYFIKYLKVKEFDVIGHSGGGTIAAMILTERPEHVKFAGLSSPILAVKAAWPYVKNWWVYDPHYHMEKLLRRTSKMPGVCVLVVWDPKDKIVKEKAVMTYINRARELRLGEDRVRLAEVRAPGSDRHHNYKNLGRKMRQLEKKGNFCL